MRLVLPFVVLWFTWGAGPAIQSVATHDLPATAPGFRTQTVEAIPIDFSTFLSPEQIEALPDDPLDLGRVLRVLAPPGAVLRIDGFTGGVMPSKTQILSIRIPRIDALAAEDHGGLSAFSAIEIVTRPGTGEWHANAGFSGGGAALDARNPLTGTRTSQDQAIGDLSFDGPIGRGRSSMAVQIRGSRNTEVATIRAALPEDSTYARGIRRPTADFTIDSRFITAIRGGQILQVGLSKGKQTTRNAGVGGGNLEERRYDTGSLEQTLRVAIGGPWGRRRQIASRVELKWEGTRSMSAIEAPTIQVLDAFTAGGAQATNGERAFRLESASDLDYTRGGHALRTGGLMTADRYGVNRRANYQGTYIFTSLDAFTAGQPAVFTRRIGDARLHYMDAQLGAYVQDDYRVSRRLLLSYGVRSEWQNLLSTTPSLLPRLGLTWSPWQHGGPTLRVNGGLVRDWLSAAIFEQAHLVDGTRQYDLRITTPEFPDPGDVGVTLPRERFLLANGLNLPRARVVSLAAEQRLTDTLRLYLSASVRDGSGLMRGVNLNAAAAGRRPDEASGNVIEARGDARLRERTFIAQTLYAPPHGHVDAAMTYVFTRSLANTAGAFWVAPTENLSREWGPLSPAHAASGIITGRWRGVEAALSPRWHSGTPYTVTLPNAGPDGLFNVRPPGVARNASRTPAQAEVGARLVYSLGLGAKRDSGGIAPAHEAGARLPSAADGAVATRRRFQLAFQATAQNLANRPNYLALGSVLGSPLFGRPIRAASARTVELGLRFRF